MERSSTIQDKNSELTMRNYFRKYWTVPTMISAILLMPFGLGIFALQDGDLGTGLLLIVGIPLLIITAWLLPCYLDLRKSKEQGLTLEDLRFPRRK